jgi:hypothetical protein
VENKGYMTTERKFVTDYFLIDFLNINKKDVIDESGKIPYYEKVQKIKDRGRGEYLLIFDSDKNYCYICDK